MRSITRKGAAALAAIALLAVACGGDDTAGDPLSAGDDAEDAGDDADDDAPEVGEDGVAAEQADLLGAGATFITPVMLEWIRDNEPGIAVNYQSIGSGGGIAQFLEETVDFGSTERFLTDEEVEDAREIRGCDPIHIPDAFGAVVPSYNFPDLDAALEAAGQDSLVLTGEVIADIYLTNITQWDDPAIQDLNPDVEIPSGDIIPVHRSDGSGTTYIFVRYLSDVSEEWAEEIGFGSEVDWPLGTIGGNGNEGVAAETQQQPGAMGYLSIAYAIENDIPMVSVINADGNAIQPTVDSVAAGPNAIIDTIPDDFRYDILGVGGDGFPIVGTHWILAWECGYDEGVAQSLRDFLTWVVTEGDDLARDLLYSPVEGDFEQRVLGQIERINAAE
ncbi:MAG: phosphate ABC transporter substrate-binding protein PstS [Nitriliruptoraceae bacterium]|nr:phosphate ABC transporter substrate-binding protein PstS [Nitriliruptoraceae bacterium]